MSQEHARSRAHWPILLIRAAIAAVAAVAVTFSPDHSPMVGLLVFGAFALLTGAALAAFSPRLGMSRPWSALVLAQGGASAAFGIAALLALTLGSQLASLVALLAMWCLATGAAELAVGLRKADGAAPAKDHVAAAGFTLVLGVVALIGRDDPVFLVGAVGAYAAVLAVYLGIAAFSLKWAAVRPEHDPATVES